MTWFVNGGDYQSKDGQTWKEFAAELASDASLRDEPSEPFIESLSFQTRAIDGEINAEGVARFQELVSNCYHDEIWDKQADMEDRNSNRMNRY